MPRVGKQLAASSTLCESPLNPRSKLYARSLLPISSYYIIGIPLGIYLAFKQDMKLSGLWIGLTVALVFTSVIGGMIVLRADWNYEVKKVMDRLESDRNAGNDEESVESI